jgi:hypothetical protein
MIMLDCNKENDDSSPLTNDLKPPVYQLERYLECLDENELPATTPNGNEPNNHANHHSARQDEIIRVAEFLFGTTLLTASLTLLDSHESIFTKVSTMHRSLWLVRGSSDASYLCLLPTKKETALRLYYCSCRSFLEKTTKKKADSALPEVCKHLLALQLIPVLGISCPHLTLSDKEFAKLVLERTLKAPSH